jgi:hypothetical protein
MVVDTVRFRPLVPRAAGVPLVSLVRAALVPAPLLSPLCNSHTQPPSPPPSLQFHLFPETMDFLAQLEKHYGFKAEARPRPHHTRGCPHTPRRSALHHAAAASHSSISLAS